MSFIVKRFEPKRIIIRQGHQAQNFYFILSGTALITKNRLNSHNEAYVETVRGLYFCKINKLFFN